MKYDDDEEEVDDIDEDEDDDEDDIDIEDVEIPKHYQEYLDALTRSQLYECVKLFYGFIRVGGIPRDYYTAGDTWRGIWNVLFNLYNEQMEENFDEKAFLLKRDCEEKIKEKDAELARIRAASQVANPPQAYQDIFEKHLELNGENAERIKMFRVSYKDTGGVKTVNSIAFQFGGRPDNRATTSPINGAKGGRPRDENPSPKSIAQREWREKNADKSTQDDAPVDSA